MTGKPSVIRAIRLHCRECIPEPKGAYLRCPTIECPAWRFRVGNPRLFGNPAQYRGAALRKAVQASPRASQAHRRPAVAEARANLLMAEAQAKTDGTPHVSGVEVWGPDFWPGYKVGERAVQAIRRICIHCCGTRDVAGTCCSPNCTLSEFRHGRYPRPGDAAPVPNIPDSVRRLSADERATEILA